MSHIVFPQMNTIILNQIILQCHCNHDLKNMHSMLFLKPPACSRKYPYSPPPGRDLPHATPPPLLLRLILSDVSGKLQSPHIPSSQTDKKKQSIPPPQKGCAPCSPSPTPLNFLQQLQHPNIPPHVVLTVTNNTKAQMLDTLFIV